MKRTSLGQSVSIVTIAILLILSSGCETKKDTEVKSVNDTTHVLASGPSGSGSVWITPPRPSGNTITFVYPGTVPSPFNKIDLSKYSVQFLPIYPAVVDTFGVDTVLAGTQVLIMNVTRLSSSEQINNYVGVGVADQPIPLLTGMFTPWMPPKDSTGH